MFTRILVPVDFSPPSDAALAYARELARTFGASLHILHVIEEPVTRGAFGPVSELYVGDDSPEVRAALLKQAHERLAHRIGPNDRVSIRATTEVMFGRVTETIADYADVNGFDLIVMGTHGRSGIAHFFMGSVAERVVRTAQCPVLTTHSAPAGDRMSVLGARAAVANA